LLTTSGHSITKETFWSGLKEYRVALLVAFVARLCSALLVDWHNPQLWEYGTIARNLLAGNGYAFTWDTPLGSFTHPTAFMPPGQVMIQWVSLFLFGDTLAAYIALFLFQVLLGVLFVYLLGKISKELFHSKTLERATVWCAALYPMFVITSSTFGTLSAVLALNALVLFYAIQLGKAIRARTHITKALVFFGFAGGLLAYFRSESPLLLLSCLAVILYLNRPIAGKLIARSSIALLVVGLTLSPWVIRNYTAFHKLLITSTNGSFNFWRGNNIEATGSGWVSNGESIWTSPEMWLDILKQGTDASLEFRYADYHMQDAQQWIKTHPTEAITLALKKAVLLWGIDWYNVQSRNAFYILVYAVTLLFLIVGIVQLRKEKTVIPNLERRDGFAIILLACILQTAIAMVFFAITRFQIYIIAMYFPIVVYGGVRAFELLNKKRIVERREQPVSTLRQTKQRSIEVLDF